MTASKAGIYGDEANDFVSFIRLKLMEEDYAIIRKHRGESKLKTYIATVIIRQFHDYYRERRGRWRTSSTAKWLGPWAERLEALVYRDGYSLAQAITMLQTSVPNVPEERELRRIFSRLPKREVLRPRSVGEVDPRYADVEQADTRLGEAELEQQRADLHGRLQRALASLPEEDRVIVHLHYLEGLSLGEVARALNLEQKPLYRRINKLREALRRRLEEEGVDAPMVRSALPSDADT